MNQKHTIIDREQLQGILQENAKNNPTDQVYIRIVKNLAVVGFINHYGLYYREVLISKEQD